MDTSSRGSPIPAVKNDDPEDVSWALQTAEAMWNRGDRAEALKWVRRAAEAASEAEHDDRALELAKSGADLASQLAAPPPVPAQAPRTAPPPLASRPPVPRSAPPPPKPATPSVAPAARPHDGPPKPAVPTTKPSSPPAAGSRPPVMTPRPPPATTPRPMSPPVPTKPPAAATKTAAPAPAKTAPPAAAPARPANAHPRAEGRPPEGRRARRSFSNLQKEAREAKDVTITHTLAHVSDTEVTQQIQIPERRGRRSRPAAEEVAPPPSSPEPSATPKAPAVEVRAPEPRAPAPELPARTIEQAAAPSGEEIENWPTQSLHSDEEDHFAERTRIGEAAYTRAAIAASVTEHAQKDAGPRAHQAMRVLLWRDQDGMHIAPVGTPVSALHVEAMVVALDPDTDLAAWLGRSR